MRPKRVLDLIISLVASIAAAPLLLAIALLVRWRLGTPVLFLQERPGFHGRPFELVKFRTMRDVFDESGEPLPDAERLTAFGRWLRSTSLDELPELWNVLRGDMSLVGPRPLLMEYLPLYSERQRRRHEMPPGITGLAQINGRNAIDWDEVLDWDVRYVENWSLTMDLTVLFSTVRTVIGRKGVTEQGEATRRRFRGPQRGERN